jgi:chromosomal replication initiator protein
MEKFVATYRSADILLVDDIQFFLKTEGSQREFFHTFNVLFQNDKQIVLSADCAPPSLKGFEPRLISRFQSGLVASIDSPDLETRIAIVNYKVEQQGIYLQADVIQQIAESNVYNVRELEGALTRVLALSKLTDKSITSDLVSRILPNIRAESRKPTIDDILNVTTRHFELTSSDIQGNTRKQEVVLARHVTMYLSKKLTGLSLKMIGANFGGRDHSTVVHACRNVEKRLKNDPDFFDLMTRFYGHLGQSFHSAA